MECPMIDHTDHDASAASKPIILSIVVLSVVVILWYKQVAVSENSHEGKFRFLKHWSALPSIYLQML